MTRKLAVPLIVLLPLVLSACGTPQEQCIRQQTRELRAVSELLAEAEGNLARGYAWREREVTRTRWVRCERARRNDAGEIEVRDTLCLRDITDTQRYRDPIDPTVEQRKRDNLAEKRAVLTRQAEAAVRACRAAYPEEG